METKLKQYKFSVVIPCYNESLAVSKTAKEIFFTLTTWQDNEDVDLGFELIFVNDGSTDNTSEKLITLEQEYENLKVIDSKVNWCKLQDELPKYMKGR